MSTRSVLTDIFIKYALYLTSDKIINSISLEVQKSEWVNCELETSLFNDTPSVIN